MLGSEQCRSTGSRVDQHNGSDAGERVATVQSRVLLERHGVCGVQCGNGKLGDGRHGVLDVCGVCTWNNQRLGRRSVLTLSGGHVCT